MFQFSKLLQGSQRSLGDDELVDRDQFARRLCLFDCTMCLFVCPLNWSLFSCNVLVCKTNWIKIIIFMSCNVNNWSLAPQLKEIFSYSNPNISLDQHSTRAVKKWWLGGDHAHLKGLETRDWWLISSYTHRFCF